jgi:phospholipase/carboxylesterase
MLVGPSFIPNEVTKAVVLCHGYGASGSDLADLIPELASSSPQTAFFCPNAPQELSFGGYEWFSLNDFQPESMYNISYLTTLIKRAQPSVLLLTDFCNHICRNYQIPSSQIIIAGFSQGGLIALQTALTFSSPVAGTIGMSAVPILIGDNFPIDSIKQKPSVLLTHGSSDTVVPPLAFDLNIKQLKSIGINPTTFVSEGLGHGIDYLCLQQIKLFLKQYL